MNSKEFEMGMKSRSDEEDICDAISRTGFRAPNRDWSDFIRGYYQVDDDLLKAKRKAYHVDEFMKELAELCYKYDVAISTSPGCCDGGAATIKDYSWDLEIPLIPSN